MFDHSRVRSDFPILRRQVNGNQLVYLYNGASAQKPQVVIDAIDARVFKSRCLVGAEDSHAAADVQAVVVFDLLHDAGNVVDVAVRRASTTGHDAVSACLRFVGLLRSGQNFLFVQQVVLLDRSGRLHIL